MAMTAPAPGRAVGGPRAVRSLWDRQLHSYPRTGPRMLSLTIVVLTTIVLYYQLYTAGAVATQIISSYHMSFIYYVNISVVGYVFGALASVLAGLADRYGRANIVTVGLLITGLLSLLGVPHAHSELSFAIVFVALGFVEGIILVATPALVRDFSPQLGRASAMGFWTLGPVIGSLIVSEVVSHTISHLHAWQDQYVICGIAGLAVFLIALVGLRELAPQLRDQLMVSSRDRALIEARAKGLDVEASLRRPFRQMLHGDIVGSAFAISVFLIIYYVAVGFFPIYFETIFKFSAAQANALGNWFWAFDAGALLVVGWLSDRLRVRKPFMVVGALGAIVFTILFALRTNSPHTGYYTFVTLLVLLSVFLGVAYAPWMASFTETVERRNPALTATGLAVWGLIIRAVIAISVFILPHIVTTVTPLVEKGPVVQTYAAKDAKVLAAVQAHPAAVAQISAITARDGKGFLDDISAHQALVTQLFLAAQTGHVPATLQAQAVTQLGLANALKLANPAVQKDLLALQGDVATLGAANVAQLSNPAVLAQLGYLKANAPAVISAAKRSPNQWRDYYWIAVGGEVLFLPLILLMAGFWDPRKARRAEQEHEALVSAELARLRPEGAGARP